MPTDKDSTERTLAAFIKAAADDAPERSIRLLYNDDDDYGGWEAQAVSGESDVETSGAGVEDHTLALYFLAENLADRSRWPKGWRTLP